MAAPPSLERLSIFVLRRPLLLFSFFYLPSRPAVATVLESLSCTSHPSPLSVFLLFRTSHSRVCLCPSWPMAHSGSPLLRFWLAFLDLSRSPARDFCPRFDFCLLPRCPHPFSVFVAAFCVLPPASPSLACIFLSFVASLAPSILLSWFVSALYSLAPRSLDVIVGSHRIL